LKEVRFKAKIVIPFLEYHERDFTFSGHRLCEVASFQ
jgi:hypothetical protein